MTPKIKDKVIELSSSKYTIFLIGFFVLCCLVLYIYFANSTVRTVTLLEKTKKDIQNVNVRVSDLESKKLFKDNDLNFENASSFGFVKVTTQTFIVNKSSKTAYSN